jgi:hypothetical protein
VLGRPRDSKYPTMYHMGCRTCAAHSTQHTGRKTYDIEHRKERQRREKEEKKKRNVRKGRKGRTFGTALSYVICRMSYVVWRMSYVVCRTTIHCVSALG